MIVPLLDLATAISLAQTNQTMRYMITQSPLIKTHVVKHVPWFSPGDSDMLESWWDCALAVRDYQRKDNSYEGRKILERFAGPPAAERALRLTFEEVNRLNPDDTTFFDEHIISYQELGIQLDLKTLKCSRIACDKDEEANEDHEEAYDDKVYGYDLDCEEMVFCQTRFFLGFDDVLDLNEAVLSAYSIGNMVFVVGHYSGGSTKYCVFTLVNGILDPRSAYVFELHSDFRTLHYVSGAVFMTVCTEIESWSLIYVNQRERTLHMCCDINPIADVVSHPKVLEYKGLIYFCLEQFWVPTFVDLKHGPSHSVLPRSYIWWGSDLTLPYLDYKFSDTIVTNRTSSSEFVQQKGHAKRFVASPNPRKRVVDLSSGIVYRPTKTRKRSKLIRGVDGYGKIQGWEVSAERLEELEKQVKSLFRDVNVEEWEII